jgi:hypothetical protein
MEKIFCSLTVIYIMQTYPVKFAGVCLIYICVDLSFYVAYRCHSYICVPDIEKTA